MSEKYYLASSKIHGQGVFAKKAFSRGELIEVGIEFILWVIPTVTTYFGRWINHSPKPNIELKYINGKYYLVANKHIPANSELVMNYHETPWYIRKPEVEWDLI